MTNANSDAELEPYVTDETTPTTRAADANSSTGRQLVIHRASDVPPEKIEWLWPGRIAMGKLTLLGGSPGLGKSQVTMNIVATLSKAGEWPCGEGKAPLGSAMLLCAEDGIADTIVPRLVASGADMGRVYVISAVTAATVRRKMFNLKADLDLLEEKLNMVGDVRLVVIDPVSAYMGGADGNGNVETREILEPIAELASRLGIAFVAVTHLNKGGAAKQSALNRVVGSIAFTAAARAVFMVVEDQNDAARRLFLQLKNNLGPTCQGLSFHLEEQKVQETITTSRVIWGCDYVSQTANEALAAAEGLPQDASGKDSAIQFLQGVLADGPMAVADVEREARLAGLLGQTQALSQSKPFRSARASLGILSTREGKLGSEGRWKM